MAIRAAAATLVAIVAVIAVSGCGGQGDFLRLTPEEQLAEARRDLAERKWSRAAREFQSLAGTLDGTPYYPEVKYGLGRAYAGMGDYPAAERELSLVTREYPESDWADDALYELAAALWEQSKPAQLDQSTTNQTIDKLREFMNRFPESNRYSEAQALMLTARSRLAQKEYENGKLYLKLGDVMAPQTYFGSVLSEYGDTDWAAWAQLGMGDVHRKDGDFEAAIAAYQAVVSGWPEHPATREAEERLRKLSPSTTAGGE